MKNNKKNKRLEAHQSKIVLWLIVLLVGIFIILPTVSSTWWNSNWHNRLIMEVQENSGANLYNYSVKINLSYYLGMNSDFSDLRFTDSNNNPLGYYSNNVFSSNHTIIFVKIPTMLANKNTTIYVYYNNPLANSSSNLEDAFLFGDDFLGSSLNNSKWQNYSAGNSNIIIGGGYVKFNSSWVSGDPDPRDWLLSYQNFSLKNLTMEWHENYTIPNEQWYAGLVNISTISGTSSPTDGGIINSLYIKLNANNNNFSATNATLNQYKALNPNNYIGWHNYSIIIGDRNQTHLKDDGLVGNTSMSFPNVNFNVLFGGNPYNLDNHEIDWVRVRPITSLEPTIYILGEFVENNNSYTYQTYESMANNFEVNVTYDSSYYTSWSANLIYNSVSYAGIKVGSGNTVLFNRTINAPAVSVQTNYSFYWDVTLTNSTGTSHYNSSFGNQTVNPIILGLCNTTNNVPYVNFTFKDEQTLTNINATIPTSTWTYHLKDGTGSKSLTFANSSLNTPSYSFCFSPADKNITVDLTMAYAFTGYPQKSYAFSGDYSNQTTNTTLYLLSTADGSYTTFQVLNTAGTPISGATVVATRVIDSVTTTVASGTTGGDGGVTFWLNPDYVHTLTFTASGYDTYVTSITPTQSLYTVQLSGGSSTNTNVSDYTKGISWAISPGENSLTNNTAYTFQFNLSSTYWTVSSWGFNITNQSGALLGSTSSAASGGSITTNVNVYNSSNVYMTYYWTTNGIYQAGVRAWSIQSEIDDGWSLANFIRDLKTYTGVGTDGGGIFGLDAFGRTIIIFVIIFLITGILTYSTGLYAPGAILIQVTILVAIFDLVFNLIEYPYGIDSAKMPLLTIFMVLATILYFVNEART